MSVRSLGSWAAVPLAVVSALPLGCHESKAVSPSAVVSGGPGTGYTDFNASPDTKKIYVSSSSGDDSNDGLSEDKPLKTIAKGQKALRDGYPDWLLLKKGDTWTESFGQWNLSGRSQDEPMVISGYGAATTRPVLKTGADEGFGTSGGGNAPKTVNHVAFVGLNFYASTRDPSSPDFAGGTPGGSSGVKWLRGTTDLLIEDCVFQFYTGGLVFQDIDHLGIANVRLHRDLVLDSWDIESRGHSEGMYTEAASLVIDECIFDHNGWNEKITEAAANQFNHNIYIHQDVADVTLKNSIIMRGSANGAQMRAGGLADGNLFVRNPIGLLGVASGTLQNNVILEGSDIDATNTRGWGIDLTSIGKMDVRSNIVAHIASAKPTGPAIADDPNTTYEDNIVYKWETGRFDTPGPFVDPERSVATYNASVGGPGTFEDFVAQVRAQSRDQYRPEYTAQAINGYIRDGFAKP